MVKGNFIELMAAIIKEIMLLIKKTDMANLCDLVARSTKDNGKMECSMEEELILILLAILRMENGSTERS
jgi:hypothetical protein